MYDVHESRFGATAGFLTKIQCSSIITRTPSLSLVLVPSRCPLSYDPWLFLSLQITTAITITVRKTHRLRGLHGWFSFALILFGSVTLKSRPEVMQQNIMFYACAQYAFLLTNQKSAIFTDDSNFSTVFHSSRFVCIQNNWASELIHADCVDCFKM